MLTINGYRIGRDNLPRIEYAFDVLRPLPRLIVTLRDSHGKERDVFLEAKVGTQEIYPIYPKREDRWVQHFRTFDYGHDLIIVKLPSFMIGENEVDRLISMGRKHKSLILDLRQNSGGSADALKVLVGGLFTRDVKICDRITRDSNKPVIAKSNHHPFDGKLVVLVDSESASAAEILARVVQLEKRGTVIGDHSAGRVMESKMLWYNTFDLDKVPYGAAVAEADLIMTDGQSLEHVGVTPDEVAIASAADLAGGRDPVLAHAAEMAGVKITPEDAGKLFPYEWPKN